MKSLSIILFLFINIFSFGISVDNSLKFSENLPLLTEYVYIKNLHGTVRESPSSQSTPLETYPLNTKLQLIGKTKTRKGEIWYEVATSKIKKGYISARTVNVRTFEFKNMLNKINEIESFIIEEIKNGKELYTINSYKPNPNNINLKKSKDKYGTSLDQNIESIFESESIFVPDGSIVSLHSLENNSAQIKSPAIKESPLTIDKKYLKKFPSDDLNIKKAIIIDTSNQNIGIFEKKNSSWLLISYAYSKTGLETHIGFETPKGFFLLQNLKNIMTYNDENGKPLGFAKYALRFSGGGYIHGTPNDYNSNGNSSFENEKILGTVSGTRKCVRTITSHSKFLLEWINKSALSKNEYSPNENVLIISI